MATATSEARRRLLGASLAAMAIAVAIAAIATARGRVAGWRHATISSGLATLSYPRGWEAIPGDPGTVSFATRDQRGRYLGYLNVTPRQGSEQLAGWAAFRTRRNAEEGDRDVRMLSAAENVRFRNAKGSCVRDEYLSRVGSNPYRELACIVSGHRGTSVFVGAALVADWRTLGPVVERSAAMLIER
jgi:hypothetical protein